MDEMSRIITACMTIYYNCTCRDVSEYSTESSTHDAVSDRQCYVITASRSTDRSQPSCTAYASQCLYTVSHARREGQKGGNVLPTPRRLGTRHCSKNNNNRTILNFVTEEEVYVIIHVSIRVPRMMQPPGSSPAPLWRKMAGCWFSGPRCGSRRAGLHLPLSLSASQIKIVVVVVVVVVHNHNHSIIVRLYCRCRVKQESIVAWYDGV